MASQQLSETLAVKKQEINHRDFELVKGEWVRLTIPSKPAILTSGTEIEANAVADDVFQGAARDHVKITFHLSKYHNSIGWEKGVSKLTARAKVGEKGTYQYQSINNEFVDMPSSDWIKSPISVVFKFPPTTFPPDMKLHFGIIDQTQHPKKWLHLHGATVETVEDAANALGA